MLLTQRSIGRKVVNSTPIVAHIWS